MPDILETSGSCSARLRSLKSLSRGLWANEFFRFLAVGAGNTVVGYLLYLLGLLVGLPYQLALAAATVLGATFNFFTTGRIVFENKSLSKIIGFLMVYGVTFAANLVLLTALVNIGVSKALSQAGLLPVIVVLSFLLNKYVVFGGRS